MGDKEEGDDDGEEDSEAPMQTTWVTKRRKTRHLMPASELSVEEPAIESTEDEFEEVTKSQTQSKCVST